MWQHWRITSSARAAVAKRNARVARYEHSKHSPASSVRWLSAAGGGGKGTARDKYSGERDLDAAASNLQDAQNYYQNLSSLMPGAGSAHAYGSLGDPSDAAAAKSIKPPVAWQAAHNRDVQRVTQTALIYELTQQQTRTIEAVVPWFLGQMPASYFRQVPEPFRMDHIRAIAAVKDADLDLYLNLKTQLPHDGRQVLTFIRPGTQPGTLLRMVEELPGFIESTMASANEHHDPFLTTMPLTRLHVFSTLDQSMSLNMFVYGNKQTATPRPPDAIVGPEILAYAAKVQAGMIDDMEPNPLLEREPLLKYLREQCSDNYITVGSKFPKRFLRQRMLFAQVSGTEGTAVSVHAVEANDGELEQEDYSHIEDLGCYWVDVAVSNSLPQVALEHTCRLLFLHRFDVSRARLDVVSDGDNGSVTMLRMLVSPTDGCHIHDGEPDDDLKERFLLLAQELKRSKWLDPTTLELILNDDERFQWLGVRRAELLTAMCSLMHPILSKKNAVIYSKSNILDTVTSPRYITTAAQIADLFLARFNPTEPLTDSEYKNFKADLREAIEEDVEDSLASELLLFMIDIIDHTLKTNVFMQNRYALGLRLDPAIMGEPPHKEAPYGVIFVHGRRFNGYHVRFRDVARGGMRLVTPASPEQFALESSRQYEECYGLAFAQQLKNKDIPEGGSKAVVLIDTTSGNLGKGGRTTGVSLDTPAGKNFVMRKSVKAFTDTLLDLVVDTEETRANIVDKLGKKEVLYLGPDEQVIPEDINWIIDQAGRRGYTTPAAFMSSKPKAGINHKEYGVTSEGVHVYLDVALKRSLGIDPKKETFTVKMTGGPDGDVAGNELKILIREYGENCKIVGIADHSGCAEDPIHGLDHGELMRLFKSSLSISNFDPSKLSPDGGVLHLCNTDEGVKARNSMHNRLEADAFLPCGGRPNTINITNYRQFLREDGTPSAPLIVEGANLFVTAEARQALYDEAGVVIVKDSSANKGGVITSSYEICSAMLLSEEEFFAHKDAIVDEVLAKLRMLAKLEAELLFREAEHYGGSLPGVSQVISNSINLATDALAVALDTLSEEDREKLVPLFRAHLPPTLARLGFDERLHERVPEQYTKNAIASCLASKLVYREGTRFISMQPADKLASVALAYVEKEAEVARLVDSLERSTNIPDEEKASIRKLLEAGGARTALGMS